MVRCESRPSTIGHITLGTKQTGAPSAGNPHAGCDVAGAGNGFTVWILRHSQRKRGATARPNLRNTAPVLDPTGQFPPIRMRMILGYRRQANARFRDGLRFKRASAILWRPKIPPTKWALFETNPAGELAQSAKFCCFWRCHDRLAPS
jgi:hypothetical protein